MKTGILKKLTLIFMAASCILLFTGFSLMLVNDGVIHTRALPAPVNADLLYNGEYIDLLTAEGRSDLPGNEKVRVMKIDTETGYPAALDLTVVDKDGRRLTRVNVVRFNCQGIPVLLRFTNNAADGFTYQNAIPELLETGGLSSVWETDPNALREVLADYTAQVSAVIR